MELTPWKLPQGTYTMEATSWNLQHKVTSWNLHHGSYLMELTPWKLPHGTYTIEVT